jgi:MFS family permease
MRYNFNRDTKLFLLSTFLYGFSFSVWSLFFNLYILALGLSSDVLGVINFASPLAALILGLPLGILSDRIGRRKSMLIGLGISFLGMFLEILVVNPFLIFFFGLMNGTGIMLYYISQPPFIMSRSKQKNQVMVFSLNFGLVTIAATVGSLVAGQLPRMLENVTGLVQGTADSYRWIITAGILLATTSLIPMALISRQMSPQTNESPRIPIIMMFRKTARQPIARQFALINIITGCGAALLIPYLNVFLIGKFGISDDILGIIFSISSLMVFLASLVSPWLFRITRSRIVPIVATEGISILFLIILGFTPILPIAIISMLLRSALMQMASPLLSNFAMLITPPEEQGVVTSVRGIGWQMGQAIGLFTSGFIQSRFGFSPLFIATSVLYTLAVMLTWVYFRHKEKKNLDAV